MAGKQIIYNCMVATLNQPQYQPWPVEDQVAKLEALRELGVDQFGLYLQHDAKDATLAAFGELVMPNVGERVSAKT